MKLLTASNPKLQKGESKGYMSFVMHLAAAKSSGYNVCPGASTVCTLECLTYAGRGRFARTQEARIRKTRQFFEERDTFMLQLVKDVQAAIRKADRMGMIPVFRLNGTSDIRWENIPVAGFPNIMAMFPTVQFYDYSKLSNRKNIPANYHLTFSRSEENGDKVEEALAAGTNVAVVFDEIPATYYGRPVIDGTETDLRFLDPQGVVVGLIAKGKAKKSTAGFVVLTRNK